MCGKNECYFVSTKIEFNADINISGHCLHGSRSLAPLGVHVTSYSPLNTAHFGKAAHCN